MHLTQSIVGNFLYYTRAIDSTMMPALNDISSEQANTTESTLKKCKTLLDYAATYPNVSVRFYESDMILHIDSDSDLAYIVKAKARSRVAGFFYMDNKKPRRLPKLNGAILIEYNILRHIVALALESKTGGIFHNAQMRIPIR